jgi:2,4-dienoyl-CoA reductase-like NADH-dependent reductase (Old Yellow Enzyme family)
MSHLFESLTLRDVTLQNRIAVSPMCQYSGENGFANDWHFVHLGSRAVGAAGLVLTESTAVVPEGRISPQDLGIWSEDHIEPLTRITHFIREQGSVAGIQLAHAGRKASTYRPWDGRGVVPEAQGGWHQVVAPSALRFAEGYAIPEALTEDEIQGVVTAFAAAARRACDAGFCVVEIHAAHGYLLHEFLSPLSNHRQDRYGGSFENRTRLAREVVSAVRSVLPERLPLFVRISATDWGAGWLGSRAIGRASSSTQIAGSRSDGLFIWWQPATGKHSRRSWLPDALCGADPTRGCDPDRSHRCHHFARAGGSHHPQWPG